MAIAVDGKIAEKVESKIKEIQALADEVGSSRSGDDLLLRLDQIKQEAFSTAKISDYRQELYSSIKINAIRSKQEIIEKVEQNNKEKQSNNAIRNEIKIDDPILLAFKNFAAWLAANAGLAALLKKAISSNYPFMTREDIDICKGLKPENLDELKKYQKQVQQALRESNIPNVKKKELEEIQEKYKETIEFVGRKVALNEVFLGIRQRSFIINFHNLEELENKQAMKFTELVANSRKEGAKSFVEIISNKIPVSARMRG